MYNQIHCEDCLETMKRLPDNSIDLILSSPPYDNMRQYGGNKSYHQRLNDTGYSFDFESVATGLARVLKDGGVIVWNVADQTIKGSRTGNSMRQALYFMDTCGLSFWDNLIWQKTGTPFPSPYRYRNVWEHMFIFSKGKPKTFNPLMKKNKTGGKVNKRVTQRNHSGNKITINREIHIKEYGMDNNVWLIANGVSNNGHPASFPIELARRHILSWSNEGDTIFDPFSGSHTTCSVAKALGRNYIGSEIHKPYYDLGVKDIVVSKDMIIGANNE
jgi:site-specific DNA-methyltransferase (adenine-specific)